MKARRKGFVVSHFHWDRAWYLPFQQFRLRLVRNIDGLLDLLETRPDFRCFTLDGQSVLLEDYLEIRPENRERIALLVENRKLFIGPWYTLPDLFLAGGEAVIRNLQIGRDLCKSFGGSLQAGYVPDSFGHFAQLPQILQGFGLHSYLFMRGLGTSDKKKFGSVFEWTAPDGSSVLAVYMPRGYLAVSALGHPADWGRFDGDTPNPELAIKKIEEAFDTLSPLQKEQSFLLTNGCDHMPVQTQLPQILKCISIPETELIHSNFEEFLESLHNERLIHETFMGDLLGNADHPILSSVYSTRTYLKQQNHAAQSLLSRYAEPLCAIGESQGKTFPTRPFLQTAWKLLLKNHAHDDICGCSVDEVHRENEVNFSQVEQISRELIAEQMEHWLRDGFKSPFRTASANGLRTDLILFNPHPFECESVIEADILFPNPQGEWAEPLPAHPLEAVDAEGRTLDIETLSSQAPAVRSRFLETSWGRSYRVRFTKKVPALGYELVHIFESPTKAPPLKLHRPQEFETSRYKLRIQDSVMTFASKTSGKDDLIFHFEIESDGGDTYSFSPEVDSIPALARVLSSNRDPQDASRWIVEHEIVFGNHAPMGLSCILRDDGEGFIAADISYINSIPNARLRAVLGTRIKSSTAWTENAFLWNEQAMEPAQKFTPQKPSYPGERNYPTRPQGEITFVEERGHKAWVFNKGLPEYELLMSSLDGTAIATTLHRAVGYLSVAGGSIRACQAGPALATPEAQCLRPFVHHLAFGNADIGRAQLLQRARKFAHPIWAQERPYLPHLPPVGSLPRKQSFLSIDNPRVQLSAFGPGPQDDILLLRIYNSSNKPEPCTLNFGFRIQHWCRSSLDGQWHGRASQNLDSSELKQSLKPQEIVTLLIKGFSLNPL